MDVNRISRRIANLLQILIAIAHISIIYILRKARLTSPRYHLFSLLSFSDFLFAVNTLLFDMLIMEAKLQWDFIAVMISTFAYVYTMLTLQITIFITVDRLLAVKYSLRYNILMNKKKINIFVGIAVMCNILIYSILLHYGEEIYFVWPSTMGTLIFTNVVRVMTMLTIIIVGRITLNIRNKSEKSINRQIDMIHGQKAEKLTILRSLKRSVKDMAVLNFWTCAFLVPVTVTAFLYVVMNRLGSKEDLSKAVLFCAYALSISNPFVYVLSQTNLKQWLSQRYRVAVRSRT